MPLLCLPKLEANPKENVNAKGAKNWPLIPSYHNNCVIWFLKQKFGLPYISEVLSWYKLTKSTVLTICLIFLEKLNYFESIEIPLIDESTSSTAITTTISLKSCTIWMPKHKSLLCLMCYNFKNNLIFPHAMKESRFVPLYLELEFFLLHNM